MLRRLMLIIVFSFTISPVQAAKLLIYNATIFTMAANQREPMHGYMLVEDDGTIQKIQAGNPDQKYMALAQQVIDAKNSWIIPGFISAHSHLWQAAYRGIAVDKTLSGWIDDLYQQRASKTTSDDLYWFCLLGALDHLENGITTAYNFNYGGKHKTITDNEFEEAQFRAEQTSGIRFIHGYQPNVMTDKSLIDNARLRLKTFLDWTKTQPASTHFLGVMLNGMTAFNTTYQQAVMEETLMQEFHIKNQSHYLEPPETIDDETAKFPWFIESGLLSSDLIFGHFVHPNNDILNKTVKAKASMVWNPLSNGRLASGIADIPYYLKQGLNVGMGVDGEASADLADPFENMRTGIYALRAKYEDAKIMSPYQVLWLHTMGSASVLGLQDKIGSLEPGKYADFLVINPLRLGLVLEDPYANLVFASSTKDIQRVYVGGDLQVKDGTFVNMDLRGTIQEVNRRIAN